MTWANGDFSRKRKQNKTNKKKHDRLLTRFRGADHTQPPVGHQVMEFWVDLG